MSKSILTKYDKNCIICGKPTSTEHHFIEGTANRKLSEKFGLKAPVCDDHHNMTNNSVHLNPAMQAMGHIIGQLAYEKRYIAEKHGLPFESVDDIEAEARESFRKIFGKSYL